MVADFRPVSVEIASPAYVLRTRPYGELDLIVTLLTDRHGKITGIAKAAKHSRRRFGGTLQPFVHVRAVFRQRPHADLVFLLRCEHLEALRTFSEDVDRFAAGSYVLDVTDRMTIGRESSHEVFGLLHEALGLLDRGAAIEPVLRAFELHLLAATGYEPALDRCRRCGSLAAAEGMYAQPARGGILCGRCRGEGRSYVISRGTLERLMALQQVSFDAPDVSGFALQPGVAAEARALLRSFFAANLTAPLASERLLDAL